MSKLSPQTRALFDAARDTDEPTDEDAVRVRSKLLLRVGAGVVAGAAGSAVAGSTAAAAAKPLALLGFKLVLALVVAGGVGGAAYSMIPSEHAIAPASSGASTPVLHVAREAAAARAATESAAAASSAPAAVAAVEDEAPAHAATNDGPRKDQARATPAPSTSGPRDDISGETALLDEAQAALRQGRADAALRALDEHARRYGDGVLQEERLGARIFALCRLGRVEEARAEAARLLRQAPRSPVAARVRGSCAAP